jgi:cytochrome oxidase assembly protein ShyY1
VRFPSFTVRLWPTLATGIGLVILVSLGTWQTQRGQEKQALAAAFARGDAPAVPYGADGGQERYAHVRLEGRYVPDRQILLDNMTHNERVGYRVLTPFRTTLGTVLVDRGWVLAPPRREDFPDIRVSDDLRSVTGRIDQLPRAGIALAASDGAGWPRRLSYPDAATVQRVMVEPLDPVIILLDASASDGYVRDWKPGGLPPERHFGYAVQWYGLALALAVIYVVVNLKRPGKPS